MTTHTTIVIPCYRESKRLPLFLGELCSEMERIGGVTVLVVDDGSGEEESERTKSVIQEARHCYSCLLPMLVLDDNAGKGGAVREGWKHANGENWLGFVDADGSCPATEVGRLISLARNHSPKGKPSAVFASRVKMLGRNVDRLLKRHLIGRVFATLISNVLNIDVYDSQCGLKLIPKVAYDELKSRLKVSGFAFDVELMVALLDNGYFIREEPIDWHEVPGGKVHLIRDSFRMGLDVLRIKRERHLLRTLNPATNPR